MKFANPIPTRYRNSVQMFFFVIFNLGFGIRTRHADPSSADKMGTWNTRSQGTCTVCRKIFWRLPNVKKLKLKKHHFCSESF